MNSKILTIIEHGMGGVMVEVECQITNGLPSINIVGSASGMVNESKERVRNALLSSKIDYPRRRITINLAPGDIPKNGTSLDLAIAMAIIATNGQIPYLKIKNHIFIGELGLDGTLRPVRGIIGRIIAARQVLEDVQDYIFIVPSKNLPQIHEIEGIKVFGADSLVQIYNHFQDLEDLTFPIKAKDTVTKPPQVESTLQINQIIGQQAAKRALQIAASGGHNCIITGPPGAGKSLLAKAFGELLPAMSNDEIPEVTHLHSLVQPDFDSLILSRPIRMPHHSASLASLVGGGIGIKPGEISLSHNGILFLDEMPEFSRDCLEALRQPLEDRLITITRANGSLKYPANFILIATANPCPCGYYGYSDKCTCSASQISNYQRRISGPLMDRIDLFINVDRVDLTKLLQSNYHDPPTDLTKITRARSNQQIRYRSNTKLNSSIENTDLKKIALLSPVAKKLLDKAASKIGLTARSYMRSVRIARTIADMESSVQITEAHIAESLQYRQSQQIFNYIST